jgi:protocatechuate 3,4-dioxygenase beta subunit
MSRHPAPSHDHDDSHHLGLDADVRRLVGRRRALQLLGGVGLMAVVGCSSDDSDATAGSSSTATDGSSTTAVDTDTSAADCGGAIPEETAGPYPGDGSNGPNILEESGIVRSDITSSIGSGSGVAEGVPLQIQLSIFDATSCKPLTGAAVYLWHCDREGRYSMYDRALTNENYLRGVQETAADGTVTFTSIFPACYSGRWPHIHFEVYPSLAAATTSGNKIATSQLALPKEVCQTVYATAGYEQSVSNLERVSLDSDMVFRDGYTAELATVSGGPDEGLLASLVVPV